MTRRRSIAVLAGAVLAAAPVVACGERTDLGADGRLVVAVAFSPIEDIVRHVGGAAVHVVTIVPPGEEAHEYEPTPKQVTRLDQADVVFYIGGGFQPSVEQAISVLSSHVRRVDLTDRLTLRALGKGTDPHVWMAPGNMRIMAQEVRDVLSALDAPRADGFARETAAYDLGLATLDDEFRVGLAHCAAQVLVTGHEAFGYLAAAYGLTQAPIAGISPGDEPSAQALEQIASFVREQHVHTVFFEENLPDDLARTIADETGAGTAALNTVESLSSDELAAGVDYLSAMRGNLAALRTGLECS